MNKELLSKMSIYPEYYHPPVISNFNPQLIKGKQNFIKIGKTFFTQAQLTNTIIAAERYIQIHVPTPYNFSWWSAAYEIFWLLIAKLLEDYRVFYEYKQFTLILLQSDIKRVESPVSNDQFLMNYLFEISIEIGEEALNEWRRSRGRLDSLYGKPLLDDIQKITNLKPNNDDWLFELVPEYDRIISGYYNNPYIQ